MRYLARQLAERLVMVGTLLLFLGLLYLWLTNPAWIFRIDALIGQQEPHIVDTGEGLEISAEDVQYMNRIYREMPNEVAYCGLIFDKNQIQPWLAEIHTGSRRHVEFTTEDCPTAPGNLEATIHTHPASASGELAGRDRQTFFERRWSYMCIPHGPIDERVGTETSQLTCYEKIVVEDMPQIREVTVQIVA